MMYDGTQLTANETIAPTSRAVILAIAFGLNDPPEGPKRESV